LFQTLIDEASNGKEGLLCGAHKDDIYTFTIEAEGPLGTINLFFIQQDAVRKIPVASTAMFNDINMWRNVTRVDRFREHQCTELRDKQTKCSITYKMTPEQTNLSGYNTFDRGHLQPVNPFRFSYSAMDNTFYCVNIAPQEPYTNRVPWFTVEDLTNTKLSTNPGFVITGTCDRDSLDGVTADGYHVPECFWKLNCYKDNAGITRVVGFIGDNSLFDQTDTIAQEDRKNTTTRPRPQREILAKMDRPYLIEDAWRAADRYLLYNRNEHNTPSPALLVLL